MKYKGSNTNEHLCTVTVFTFFLYWMLPIYVFGLVHPDPWSLEDQLS